MAAAKVKFGEVEEIERDPASHDFLPIVSLDTGQLTSAKKYTYEYKDFEIVENLDSKITSLSKHLDDDKKEQALHAIKIYQETIVRFTVEKGNTDANDDDGKLTIKPHGVTVLSNNNIKIEYGQAIALKIDANGISDDAYIDFYASDIGGFFDKQGLTNIHCGRVKVQILETFLVLYGSGFLRPGYGGHHTGDAFKLIAEARNEINKKNHPNRDYKMFYCPTDKDFFEYIDDNKNIKRLDIYSHAWGGGLNFGGFIDSRVIGGVSHDGSTIDWSNNNNDDFRHFSSNEVVDLNSKSFSSDTEIYIWGCNAGGQLTSSGIHVTQNDPLIADPKITFVQKLAEAIGKGNVYALVGKGTGAGSMFKTDKNSSNVYSDGEMLPANIALNHGNKNTITLKAMDYMKKFPL